MCQVRLLELDGEVSINTELDPNWTPHTGFPDVGLGCTSICLLSDGRLPPDVRPVRLDDLGVAGEADGAADSSQLSGRGLSLWGGEVVG